MYSAEDIPGVGLETEYFPIFEDDDEDREHDVDEADEDDPRELD